MSRFYGYEDKIDIKDPPTEDDNINSKKYTDTKLLKRSGTMSGDLDMNLYKLKNIPAAINRTDPISKLYMINYLNLHLHSPLAKTLIWEYFTKNA